uniref:Tafazzin family protein n=1 Tax=Cacopsylla melanoneura TaxID=428564 RepID=A0A8D8Q1A2_9HEMI
MIYNFTQYRNLPKHVFSTFRMVCKTSESTSSDSNHYREYSAGVKKTKLLQNTTSTSREDCTKLPQDMNSIEWIFPVLKKRSGSYLWYWASTITVAAVGILSKWFLICTNKVHRHNAHILQDAFDNRPPDTPLITVSNHHSCFDDPGLWVLLKNRQLCSHSRMRWSMAAHDICFTRASHSYFFMLGKCVPVVRGAGIHQEAVNFALSKLSRGEWVHIFPEGKVNMDQTYLRFKWGIARMILESPVTPMVIPMWHIGMETVLPNQPPYYFRCGKTVTFNVGPPLDLGPALDSIRASGASDEEARSALTRLIQDKLYELKRETQELHQEHVKCKTS